jgi:uncharacterized protein (DUF697 family)
LIVKALSVTVSVPVLAGPVLAAASNAISPGPWPDAGAICEIQLSAVVALHRQSGWVVTCTVTVAAAAPIDREEAGSEISQRDAVGATEVDVFVPHAMVANTISEAHPATTVRPRAHAPDPARRQRHGRAR